MYYVIKYSVFLVILKRYGDVNWISNLDETKLTSGYVFTLDGGVIT